MKGTIDALFGSKTRIKLLQLFLNNPSESYYVREITRMIDEQINSVRRELANMLNVGIITSKSSDNRLYYQANQRYEFYVPLRAIFAGTTVEALESSGKINNPSWYSDLEKLKGSKLIVLSGVLVEKSTSDLDILVVGSVSRPAIKKVMSSIESFEGRDMNYALLSFDDFYYRYRVKDKFVSEVFQGDYELLVDRDSIIAREK